MKRSSRRAGFTLVELIVVITIIIVLAGLSAIVASSGLFDNYRNVGANDRVTGWLITSKAWAQRDKAPRGVRFIINSGICREAQYIEVPEPYYPNVTDAADPPRLVIRYSGGVGELYMTGPAADLGTYQSNITTNDSIQIAEFNLLLKVTAAPSPSAIQDTTKVGGGQINGIRIPVNATLLPKLGSATLYQTTSFVVHRQPQALMGEPMLQVPNGMVIDFNGLSQADVVNNGIDQTVDILFSANGDVLNTSRGMTILWLHKEMTGYNYTLHGGGLAVVYTRTGAIATHPIITTGDPYSAAKDGINTGF